MMSFSRLVTLASTGQLVYTADIQGNILPDFSDVGYKNGAVPLPGTQGTPPVPVKMTVQPKNDPTGDDGPRIQHAIDQVSEMNLKSGTPGAVLLKAGDYYIKDHIEIRASGVVLRGEGRGDPKAVMDPKHSDPKATVLHAVGTGTRYYHDDVMQDHNEPTVEGLIRVMGDPTGSHPSGTGALPLAPGASVLPITDTYVPVGARSFHVASTAGLAVGNAIIVHRPCPCKWIQDIHMDQAVDKNGHPVCPWPADPNPTLDKGGPMDLDSDRIITAIDPTNYLVTIDAPLTNALEVKYGAPLTTGGTIYAGAIYRYAFPDIDHVDLTQLGKSPGRIHDVGVENLRGVSDFDPRIRDDHGNQTDEHHAWTFISLLAVDNAWVRDITAQSFAFSAVHVQKTAKRVTVANSSNLDPISMIKPNEGGNRRYSFAVGGQLTLVRDAYARNGRHDFVLGSVVPGPNVFLNCTADDAHSESGPHDRWSTGVLYDNVVLHAASQEADSQAGGLNAYNRGVQSESLHGWSGANMVFWNSTAGRMLVEKPPTAQNWAIGDTAPIETLLPPRQPGYFESVNQAVQPQSLYLTQLQFRLAHLTVLVDVSRLVHLTVDPVDVLPSGGFDQSFRLTNNSNVDVFGPLNVGDATGSNPSLTVSVFDLPPEKTISWTAHFPKSSEPLTPKTPVFANLL